MAVKIRLARRGRKQRPFYHIVIADARAPRDGKFIEQIGSYNPMTSPATIEIDTDKALDWISKGAQPTDTARAILRYKGVMFKKHLLRGLKKGALTQEQVDEQYNAFMDKRNQEVQDAIDAEAKKTAEYRAMINGTAPAPKAAADVEAQEAFREGGEEE